MIWHEFSEEYPTLNQKIIVTDGEDRVAFAIWRGGLTNVMGLQGTLPGLHTFTHWISLKEMLDALPSE